MMIIVTVRAMAVMNQVCVSSPSLDELQNNTLYLVLTGTSACPAASFWCRNKGYIGHHIRASRVNDGLCGACCRACSVDRTHPQFRCCSCSPDCCDGSDEHNGVKQCANECINLGMRIKQEKLDAIARVEKVRLVFSELSSSSCTNCLVLPMFEKLIRVAFIYA